MAVNVPAAHSVGCERQLDGNTWEIDEENGPPYGGNWQWQAQDGGKGFHAIVGVDWRPENIDCADRMRILLEREATEDVLGAVVYDGWARMESDTTIVWRWHIGGALHS